MGARGNGQRYLSFLVLDKSTLVAFPIKQQAQIAAPETLQPSEPLLHTHSPENLKTPLDKIHHHLAHKLQRSLQLTHWAVAQYCRNLVQAKSADSLERH